MNILDVSLPEVENRNSLINAIGRRVFSFANENFYLMLTEPQPQTWARLEVTYLGQEHTIWASAAMVNAHLASLSLSIEEMSHDAMALWLLSVMGSMPNNLQIRQISLTDEAAPEICFGLYSYTNNASLDWQVGFQEDFPMASMVDNLAPFCKGVLPPLLGKTLIPLPLVACTMSLPATEVDTLVVGDVLLLGGV
jgi:hypothetical protein